jgi:hypothetical protein
VILKLNLIRFHMYILCAVGPKSVVLFRQRGYVSFCLTTDWNFSKNLVFWSVFVA